MGETAYVAAGYVVDRNLPLLSDEDLALLTHVNVAFGQVRNDEIDVDHLQNLHMLAEIKRKFPHVCLLLSVGGWGAGGFSEAAATEAGRVRMAQSAVRILQRYPFDGIDLDWEYPGYSQAGIASSPEDKFRFTLLLRTMREALDRQGERDGRHYLLTIAAGADQFYVDGTQMDAAQSSLDFVQLMTYDMRGAFQTLTGHHTNLYTSSGDLFRISVDRSVQIFERAGVPKEKMVIGAAFYSRKWRQVPNRNNGLHQLAGAAGEYGPDFSTLDAEYIGKNGFTRYWDDEAKAPYLFNGDTFITYDDEESIRHKCGYVKEQGLAGIMFWEFGGDRTRRLLKAIGREFGRLASE
jgi:chitinase